MARTNYFKGKSIESIMDMDISDFLHLEKTQLRQAVSRLADAANKRIKRLESKGLYSPALYEISHSGGKLSTKGKDLMQLRAEFMRATGFLKSEASTIKGATGLISDIQEELKKAGIEANAIDTQEMMKLYNQLSDMDPNEKARIFKYKLKNVDIRIEDPNLTTEQIVSKSLNAIDNLLNPGGAQYDGISSFFEFEEDL